MVIKGSKCEDQNEVDKKSDIEFGRVHDPSIVILGCKGTLLNSKGITRKKSEKTPAYCTESCKLKIKKPFFGDLIYSDKSSICRAAF